MDEFKDGADTKYAVGTIHDEDYSPSTPMMGHDDNSLNYFIHSHPGIDPDMERKSMGEYPTPSGDLKRVRQWSDPKTHKLSYGYYTYFPESKNLYSVDYDGPHYKEKLK